MASSVTSPNFSPINCPKLPLRFPRLLNNLRLPPATSSKSAANATTFWSAAESDVETHLLASLPASPPRVVTSPMRRVLSAAPRTIFPSLSLAACGLAGGDHGCAVPAASVIATCLAVLQAHGSGPTRAELLAGDSLLPLAFEILVASDCVAADPARISKAAVEINGLVRAYCVEEGREGRIGECAAACGAILGGGGEGEVERLRRFGYNAGVMHGMVNRGRREAAEEFKMRATREVEEGGFEEGKVEMAKELVQMWCGGTRSSNS
ncbi:heterodimeric geranylgeranyl pyrophosphate synthase small subunit 1, chloroplastic-like [Typha latifolia]|uniref:heterodimeric geranylgeranyl pyrophosphate synthase small subunit 1, chloroplastic-like n=1 Tax=Typha latifolia TaxID=4733 RepID=UPI003C2C56EB